MTTTPTLRALWLVALLTMAAWPPLAGAQEPVAVGGQPAPREPEEEEAEAPIEMEAVTSTVFQAATLAMRIRGPLLLETHGFGLDEEGIGMAGLAWEFRVGAVRLVPGAAWAFASHAHPAPVLTLRWSYESPRWLTQGLFVQSLREQRLSHEEAEEAGDPAEYASILDGNHVSLRVGRLDLGVVWEHIQYRAENEWKGGGRAAWELGRGFRLLAMVVAPEPELRVGFAYEP